MASPQLKKTAVAGSPRKLINSGVVPTTQVRLKGTNGQIIKPKAPVSPFKKKAEKQDTAAATDTTEPTPTTVDTPETAPAPAPAPAEAPAPAPEPAAKADEPQTEPTAEAAPEEEKAPAGPTAEEIALKEAQEAYERELAEYNRQMEEYNRQMEEYNRQMAALLAAEGDQAASAISPQSDEAAADKADAEPAATPEPEAKEEPATATPEPEAKEEPAAATPEPEVKEEPATTPEPEAKEEPAAATPEPEAKEEPAAAPAEEAPTPKPAAKLPPVPKAAAKKPAQQENAATPAKPKPQLSKAVAKPTLGVKKAGIKKAAPGIAKAPKAAPAASDTSAVSADSAEAPDAEIGSSNDAVFTMPELQTSNTPIYKNKLFLTAVAGLVVFGGICGYVIMNKMAENEAKRVRYDGIKKVLHRAQDINKEGIETLADAKAKNTDVSFTAEETQFLMDIVVNPKMLDIDGKQLFKDPKGTAQLAVLGISLACEANNEICASILERMETQAKSIDASLYRWLVQRLAVANIKGINSKLRKLADAIGKIEDIPSGKRNELLSHIWEAMGLRVTRKDIAPITKILSTPDLDNKISSTLFICLRNIVFFADPEQRPALGDEIFDALPKKLRPQAASVLALSCSPKALEYFKKRADDHSNWRTDFDFFANYGSDDILPFLQEMKVAAVGDAKNEALVQSMLNNQFAQNRERTMEQAEQILSQLPAYDKVNIDTSEWEEINEKTDLDSQACVRDSNPQLYEELLKKRADIEACRKQKLTLIHVLSRMHDLKWVCEYLEKFAKEDDAQIAREANKALEKTRENRENEEKLLKKNKSRSKE